MSDDVIDPLDDLLTDVMTLESYVDTLVSCCNGLCKTVNKQEKKLASHERMIEILMEMVNEQRDTIQLIRYAFED